MFFAKILSYALNAYLDAKIAEEIIFYFKTKGKSFASEDTISKQRAEKLVSNQKKTSVKDYESYIIGLAYTQYYLNGLADILYANLLWKLYITKRKNKLLKIYQESIIQFHKGLNTDYQFEEIIHKSGILLWYWPLVIIDPWRWTEKFAQERCNYYGTLNKNILRLACLEVQKQNIKSNLEVAKSLRKGDKSRDLKVLELRRVAKYLDNDSQFLNQSADTQEAAAKWDKLFTKLVNVKNGLKIIKANYEA